VETYGPRGTDKYSFNVPQGVPEQYMGGSVAESWEWTGPLTVVLHIREGVMWAGNKKIGMDPRPLTAEDVAYGLNLSLDNARAMKYSGFGYIDSVTSTKDTVLIKFHKFSSEWSMHLGYHFLLPLWPKEVREAGAKDWRNHVSAGPFILTEFVAESYAIYKRNPDWWGTTTINGKEYQLPFIDELVSPVIPDETTTVSAIRTGKLDWQPRISEQYKKTLSSTSPDLKQAMFLNSDTSLLGLMANQKPFNNRNVRRALMIGTDIQAVIDGSMPGGEYHGYPMSPATPFRTPLEDLPDSAKVLFSNDKELAKKMLAEEGYPDGFDMILNVLNNRKVPGHPDAAQIIKEQWKEIGVNVTEINLGDWPSWAALNRAGKIQDTYFAEMITNFPLITFKALGGHNKDEWFWCKWENKNFRDQYDKATATKDADERAKIWTEMAVFFLEEAAYIPLGTKHWINAWWPWVKNYYGEGGAGYSGWQPLLATLWIDQDLKAKMGY
jgi:peptide/nickel transport system substrate-binding protein